MRSDEIGMGRARRLARTLVAEPVLIVDALATMLLASLMIRLLPFRWTLAAAGAVKTAKPALAADREIARCRWAVTAWGRRLPWRTKCFEQGLSFHWLARRRGVETYLHYGLAAGPEPLSAHVWISVMGRIVLGDDGGRHRGLLVVPAPRTAVA